MRMLLVLAVALAAQAAPATIAQTRRDPEAPRVRARVLRLAVVNTPDVLLDDLLPVFQAETGYRVTLHITENVYDLARRGEADLVIAHYGHPGTESFMTERLGRWPRMVFANQAALVGPSHDPAAIGGLADAVDAFRRIVERGGEFIVNNAPTERYLAEVLWESAGRPAKGRWWLDLGQRDQAVVETASQRGAYTLWGIVPFVRLAAQRPLRMTPLVVGDPILQRVMVSIVLDPHRIEGVNAEAASALQQFLIEPRTQARIRRFRHHGLAHQTWWPAGRHNAGTELAVP